LNGIAATLRESAGPEDTPEALEIERQAAQEFIYTGILLFGSRQLGKLMKTTAEPLTDEELARKDELIERGFHEWSRRDFQQFVKALEAYGW
jgi:SWI/SNF-related matrix-associated actin-dependent regulator of chromatin subfamily A member 5